jgi:hypothetical protein
MFAPRSGARFLGFDTGDWTMLLAGFAVEPVQSYQEL